MIRNFKKAVNVCRNFYAVPVIKIIEWIAGFLAFLLILAFTGLLIYVSFK